MLFARSLRLEMNAGRPAVKARLAAAIVPARDAFPFGLVPVAEWLARFECKAFVGTLAGDRFKLAALGEPRRRFGWRGSVVVVCGTIDEDCVRATLRPPWPVLAFLALFAVAVSAAFVLSFFGPSNTPAVQAWLAGMLVLPLAIVVWMFRMEARQAEQALRDVICVASPR